MKTEEVISELMNLNYSGSKKVKNNFRAFFSRPSLDINSIKFNSKVLNEKNPLVAYFGYIAKGSNLVNKNVHLLVKRWRFYLACRQQMSLRLSTAAPGVA